jgi:hypothetical protein
LYEPGIIGIVAERSANGGNAGGYGGIADSFGLPNLSDQLRFRDGPSGISDQIKKEVEGLGANRYRLSFARKSIKSYIDFEDIKSVERHSIASRPLQTDSSAGTRNSLFG